MDKFYLDLNVAIKSAFIDLELALKDDVEIAIPFICGAPGGGKTASIKAECEARDWNLLVRNTAMMLYEEFSGIPDVKTNEKGEIFAQWSKPQLVEDAERLAANGKPVLIFFDDWHRTNASIQSLGFETFSAKINGFHTLKGFSLPKKTIFLIAGNDSVAAGAREQLSAIMNRVSKKYVKTNYDYWKNEFALGKINPIILGFLDQLDNHKYFHMEESQFEPWASPRSWTYLSTKMSALESSKLNYGNPELVAEFSSYIGTEAASKLIQYWIYYKTVNVVEIFKTGHYKIPPDIVSRYIFSYAISYEFVNRWNNSALKASAEQVFCKILNDVYKISKESGAIMISNVAMKHTKITEELTRKGLLSAQLLKDLLALTHNMGQLEHK